MLIINIGGNMDDTTPPADDVAETKEGDTSNTASDS